MCGFSLGLSPGSGSYSPFSSNSPNSSLICARELSMLWSAASCSPIDLALSASWIAAVASAVIAATLSVVDCCSPAVDCCSSYSCSVKGSKKLLNSVYLSAKVGSFKAISLMELLCQLLLYLVAVLMILKSASLIPTALAFCIARMAPHLFHNTSAAACHR